MTPRRKRLFMVLGAVAGVGLALALALQAFQDNVLYYYSPTQVAEGAVPDDDRRFRVGGLVAVGTVERAPGDMTVSFELTDGRENIEVTYSGILPNLFREEQGVIAHGNFGADGRFEADEILAKHDENYMAPEVKDSLHETEWQRQQREESEGQGGYGEEY